MEDLAGVTATTAEGSPDAEYTIRVRGGMSITEDNSPLYVIDGVQMENALSIMLSAGYSVYRCIERCSCYCYLWSKRSEWCNVITTQKRKPGKTGLATMGLSV